MGWQKTTGYGRRNHAETTIGRYKHLIGPKLLTRSLPGQQGKVAVAVLNTTIRTAKPVSVRTQVRAPMLPHEIKAQHPNPQRLVVPGQHRAGEVVEAARTRLPVIPLPVRLRVVASVPDHRVIAAPRATYPLWVTVLAHEGEALGVVHQAREVDQVRRGHDSEAFSRELVRLALPPSNPMPLSHATQPQPHHPETQQEPRSLAYLMRQRCRGSEADRNLPLEATVSLGCAEPGHAPRASR